MLGSSLACFPPHGTRHSEHGTRNTEHDGHMSQDVVKHTTTSSEQQQSTPSFSLFAALVRAFFSLDTSKLFFTLLLTVTIPLNILHMVSVQCILGDLTFAEKNTYQSNIFEFVAFRILTASSMVSIGHGLEMTLYFRWFSIIGFFNGLKVLTR